MTAFVTIVAGALGAVVPQYQQIAPGVKMPIVNCGGGPWRGAASESNFSEWLSLACKDDQPCLGGLDTALTYGVRTQTSVGDAIRESGLPREHIFVSAVPDKLSSPERRFSVSVGDHQNPLLSVSWQRLSCQPICFHCPCGV